VSLKYYITGSLAGELQDTKRNGELVQTSGGTSPNGSGLVAGVVLYNEGFIALTGDWSLDPLTSERYNWCPNAEPSNALQCDEPRWKYWGQLGDPDDDPANDLSPYAAGDPTVLFHLESSSLTESCGSDVSASGATGISYLAGQSGFGNAAVFDGSTSVFFINTSDMTQTTTNSLHWDGEFTVDLWIRFDDAQTNNIFWGSKPGGGLPQYTNNRFDIAYLGDAAAVSFPSAADDSWLLMFGPGSGTTFRVAPDGPLSNDTWYHVAVTRDSSDKLRIFRDGVGLDTLNPMGSETEAASVGIDATWDFNPNDADTTNGVGYEIGSIHPYGGFAGMIDEIRIIKGTAAWTSDFTPPSPHTCPTSGTVNTGDCKSSNIPYSSFDLSFNGTSYIPTVTMLAHAKKGELNHSNNPTFLTHGQSNAIISSTGSLYAENSELAIKNTVKSPYDGYEATFQKQTWISQIGIYDEDRNLIAIAKLANPVRKTEDREFTFKLKLDI
jgi:hypothetical protein